MNDQVSIEEWKAFLSSVGMGEATINSLMDQQSAADDFFSDLENAISQQLSDSLDFHLPEGYRIGNYALSKEIGKGGMSKVYLANRVDNLFDQQVAIKFLSPALNVEKYESYFDSERKLLAALNHPNIGKIFDGGVSSDGLPYIVMEYIEGIPLTEYVFQNKPDTKEVIRKVIDVCHAVQHAHSNFVLHSDIKPSNVLITKEGTVKLLDFGIGKFLDNSQVDDGAFGGTLAYASPEQLKNEPLTTQSDTYQIGVLTFELLTGVHPFSGKPEEIKKNILAGQVQKPHLNQDLEAVLSRCMAIDSGDRYESVASFMTDLQNYLKSYPVSARSSSWSYRLRLLVKRNKVSTSLLLLIMAVSITAAVITRIQIIEKEQERKKVQQANDFLTRIFDANDPDLAQGEEISAVTLLQNSEEELNSITDPEVKAYAQNQLGELYKKLGLWEESGPLFFSALENYEENNPQEYQLEIANVYNNIAGYYRDISEYNRSDSMLKKAIPILESLKGDHSLALARSYQDLAYVLFLKAEYSKAEKRIYQAIELLEGSDQETSQQTNPREIELAFAYNTLSSILREQSQLEEALEISKKSVALGEKYADQDLSVLSIPLNSLALIYDRMGQHDKQIAILTELLEQDKTVYSADNPKLIGHIANLGSAYHRKGDIMKADSLNQVAYEAYLNKFGPYHNYTVSTLYNLANSKYRQQKYEEANTYFKRVLEADIQNLGEEHPYVAGDMVSLGMIQHSLENYDQAEKYYLDAFAIYTEKFGENHQKISYTHSWLGALYGDLKNYEKAKFHYQKAIAISKNVLGEDHKLYQKYVDEWETLQADFQQKLDLP